MAGRLWVLRVFGESKTLTWPRPAPAEKKRITMKPEKKPSESRIRKAHDGGKETDNNSLQSKLCDLLQ